MCGAPSAYKSPPYLEDGWGVQVYFGEAVVQSEAEQAKEDKPKDKEPSAAEMMRTLVTVLSKMQGNDDTVDQCPQSA